MLQVAAILQALGDMSVADRSMNGQASVSTNKTQPGMELESALHKGSLRNLIGTSKEQLVEAERAFLTKLQALLQVCSYPSLGWYLILPPPGTMFHSQNPIGSTMSPAIATPIHTCSMQHGGMCVDLEYPGLSWRVYVFIKN